MKILLTLVILCGTCIVFAQPLDPSGIEYKRSFWGEGGAGYANGNIGITGCASLEILKHVILSYEFDGSFDPSYVIGEPTSTDTESRGFTLGYLEKTGQIFFYVTAGATRIRGVIRENGIERDYQVWSTKLRAGFLYTWEYVAIGVTPYININTEVLYGGVTANLAFGRFIKVKD